MSQGEELGNFKITDILDWAVENDVRYKITSKNGEYIMTCWKGNIFSVVPIDIVNLHKFSDYFIWITLAVKTGYENGK